MKYIFVIGMWVICYSSNAQIGKKLDCILLKKSVKTEIFQKQFNICSSQENISIIDTGMYFNGCILPEVCNRNLLTYSETNSSISNDKAIYIYRIEKYKNTYKVYFFRPLSGASLNLRVKYKNGRVKILDYEVGAF